MSLHLDHVDLATALETGQNPYLARSEPKKTPLKKNSSVIGATTIARITASTFAAIVMWLLS